MCVVYETGEGVLLTPTQVGSYHSPRQSHINKMPQAGFNPPVAEGKHLLNEKVFTL